MELLLFNELAIFEFGFVYYGFTERIWGVLQKLVRIIAETFETDNQSVLDALINRSETFNHYINFDRLEIAKAT